MPLSRIRLLPVASQSNRDLRRSRRPTGRFVDRDFVALFNSRVFGRLDGDALAGVHNLKDLVVLPLPSNDLVHRLVLVDAILRQFFWRILVHQFRIGGALSVMSRRFTCHFLQCFEGLLFRFEAFNDRWTLLHVLVDDLARAGRPFSLWRLLFLMYLDHRRLTAARADGRLLLLVDTGER